MGAAQRNPFGRALNPLNAAKTSEIDHAPCLRPAIGMVSTVADEVGIARDHRTVGGDGIGKRIRAPECAQVLHAPVR